MSDEIKIGDAVVISFAMEEEYLEGKQGVVKDINYFAKYCTLYLIETEIGDFWLSDEDFKLIG